MSKEYKHSEQKEPTGPGQKRYKISYWGYINSKSNERLRAYKIVYAADPGEAKRKADLYKPLIYDISEL